MLAKKFLLLIISVLVFSSLSFGATFTVTSNADAGPGSLRDALEKAAANGVATQDIIKFNLPGNLISDRIIRLKSQLPAITSNLIIDGTTQSGAVFGVSDARVVIEPEISPAYFSALTIYGDAYNGGTAAKSIEIYGLYIRNFAKITDVTNPNQGQGSGIVIIGEASAITIGAPGKGNVICNTINGIINTNNYYDVAVSDIQIQSNIIGLLDDGFTAAPNFTGVNLTASGNVTIGGNAANKGNVISANVTGVSVLSNYYYTNYTISVTIQNNKIGTNFAGTADFKNLPIFQQSAFVKTYGIFMTIPASAAILDNLISGQRSYGVYIENATYIMERNKIGTDITGTKGLGNGEGIHAGLNSTGIIGEHEAGESNIIAFNTYGIEAINSLQTLITRNSIFCNEDYGINVSSTYYQVPFVKVIGFSGTKVSGVATPNAKIELFYTDDCGENCQGKTYITTVTANSSGVWSYSGTITKPVIATATVGNINTSPFSSLVIQDSDIEIKQFTCDYKGSITIKPAFTGLEFHWDKKEQNGSLTPKGDTKNIGNLQPGTYQLTVQYPGGCQKSVKLFTINDLRISIQNLILPTPQCREKFFQVDVNYKGGTGNVTFTWKNTAGEVKSTVKNGVLPGGTFTLTIADDAGCSVTTEPFTIKPKPGPDYDISTMNVTPARCGEVNGSIKDITTYVGIGTLSYKWFDQAGKVVGTSKDLVNVVSGLYTLQVIDQSECSPYSKEPIFVPEVNSITISGGFITNTTCGNSNGAISGVFVSNNVDFVQWYDPNGNAIPTTLNNYSNLGNLSPGTYHLSAKRTVVIDNKTYVCTQDAYFPVQATPPETFIFTAIVTPTTCELDNGGIKLQFSGTNSPSSYKWVDANGFEKTTNPEIKDVPPGNYTLMVTDKYGCPSTLGTWIVQKTPLLAFAGNNPVPTADQCNQKLGHIDGVAVTGGIAPYNYKWIDNATGQPVGNGPALAQIGKGDYSLIVTDATTCAIPLKVDNIIVDNIQFVPSSPVLADKRICVPETVNLGVINPITGNYNLYADATSAVPIQTSAIGSFNVPVFETSDYYVSYNIGTCESLRTRVHVEVVLVDIKLPNAFTPNEDGTNDYWKIEGLQKFPGAVVQVYTRGGQKVFESKNYAIPFVGKQNNTLLPAGVYYYIINLNTPCDLLSGNLTIIR